MDKSDDRSSDGMNLTPLDHPPTGREGSSSSTSSEPSAQRRQTMKNMDGKRVRVRYLSGDDVYLSNCATINDIRVKIAEMHNTVGPAVTLFTTISKGCEPLSYSSTVPSAVTVVLQEMPEYTMEQWITALISHAAVEDRKGLERVKGIIMSSRGTEVLDDTYVRELCAMSLIKYVKFYTSPHTEVRNNEEHEQHALCLAALPDLKQVVRLLLDSKADVNHADYEGSTALIWAAYKGYADVVELLTDAQAALDYADNEGYTALHNATFKGHKRIVDHLIKSGTNVKSADNEGGTALHNASYSGHTDVIEMLLVGGADANAVDNEGRTPLHYACYQGMHGAVSKLLEHGATLSVHDNNNRSPLQYAQQGEKHDIIELLMRKET